MSKLVLLFVAIIVGLWLLKFLIRIAFHVAVARSPQTKKRALEHEVPEEADWFGTTGLDEATEREVPRYLRRELGEYLDDPGGLKAADLTYLGVLTDERGSAHFWAMPARHGEQSFAYVDLDPAGGAASLGWGDRSVPEVGASGSVRSARD